MQMPKSIKELPFKQYDAGNGGVKYKIDVSQVNINHEMMYLCEFTVNSKYHEHNWYGCTVYVHSFRMLISKREKDYRIFEDGKEKVSAPSLNNYIGTYTYCNISKKSEKLLKRLCGSKTTGNHEVDNLWHMLEEWKTAKIAKQRVESGYIDDAEVYKCPAEYPNGFLERVRETVSGENVILYKKGNVRGRCFVCGEYVKTPYTQKFIQYQRQICPNCGAKCLCVLEDGAAWLAEKVDFSEATAQRFMRLAKEYSNPSPVADLGVSKALVLLALPDFERDEFVSEKHTVNGEEKTVADREKLQKEIETLKAKMLVSNSETMTEFKIYFNDFQALGNKMLGCIEKTMSTDNAEAEKFKKAVYAICSKFAEVVK